MKTCENDSAKFSFHDYLTNNLARGTMPMYGL